MPERIAYLDVLKIVGCLLVIMLHAISPWVTHNIGSPTWFCAMLASAFTHQAVPIFLMVSGAVLLNREIADMTEYYKKILVRYAIPLAAALVAYKLWGIFVLGQKDWFEGLFYNLRNNPGFHLWYLWLYLGIVVAFPVFYALSRSKLSRSVYLGGCIFFGCLEPFLKGWNIIIPIFNTTFVVYGGYFVAGYHLHLLDLPISRKRLLFVFSLVVLLNYAISVSQSIMADKFINSALVMSSLTLFLCTALGLLLFKSLHLNSSKWLTFFAQATFSVYVLHIFWMMPPPSFLAIKFTPIGLLYSIVYLPVTVFLLCVALTVVLRKIPGFKMLLP